MMSRNSSRSVNTIVIYNLTIYYFRFTISDLFDVAKVSKKHKPSKKKGSQKFANLHLRTFENLLE